MYIYYIFTIFGAIFIMALIANNSIEAYKYAAEKQSGDSQLQSGAFDNQAFKTKENLEVFEDLAKNYEEQSNRPARQAFDFLSIFPESLDNGNIEEQKIVPVCTSDICKAQNCGNRIWSTDHSKYSLKSAKELNSLIESLKQESKIIPRGIYFYRNGNSIGDANADNEMKMENVRAGEGAASEESSNENRDENLNDQRQKRFKTEEKIKHEAMSFKPNTTSWLTEVDKMKTHVSDNFRNAQPSDQISNSLKQNNLINTQPISDGSTSDVSSCQHCSENLDTGKMKNNFKLKSTKTKPFDIYGSKGKLSKTLKKTKANKNLDSFKSPLKVFKEKYAIDDDSNDDDDEEEDNLYKAVYSVPKLADEQPENQKPASFSHNDFNFKSLHTHHEDQNDNCLSHNDFNLPSLEANGETKKSPSIRSLIAPSRLNDQLEKSENNLSHEANYKLSKDEQNAAEHGKEAAWKMSIFKRSQAFNPMHEIKLKTSRRLMDKGFGASLPSYSLGETRQDLMIDDMIRKKEKEMQAEKERKFKKTEEEFEENIKESNKQTDEFTDLGLEPIIEILPLKDWNSNRKKRISDTSAQYKREPNTLKYEVDSEAFTEATDQLEKNLKALKERQVNKRQKPNENFKPSKSDIYQENNDMEKLTQPQPKGLDMLGDVGKLKLYLQQANLANMQTFKRQEKRPFKPEVDYGLKDKPLWRRKRSKQMWKYAKGLNHKREDRSLKRNLVVAISAASHDDGILTSTTKMLLRKARDLQKHIKRFFKKVLNHLPFQKEDANSSSSLIFSEKGALNSTFANEQNLNESFKIVNTTSAKTFLDLPEKYPPNTNDSNPFKSFLVAKSHKLGSLNSTFERSHNEKLLNLSHFKGVPANSNSFADKNYHKILLKNLNERFKRHPKSHLKLTEDLFKSYKKYNKTQHWLAESFLKYMPNLKPSWSRFIDTFKNSTINNRKVSNQPITNSKRRQENEPVLRIFSTKKASAYGEPQKRILLKLDEMLSLNGKHAPKMRQKKITNDRTTLNKLHGPKKQRKPEQDLNFLPKTENRKTPKRLKRSLNTGFQGNHYKADKSKIYNKRNYFPHYSDLYKLDYKFDMPYKQQIGQENFNFNEPHGVLPNEVLPTNGERDKSLSYYTLENSQKQFNNKDLDILNGSNQAVKLSDNPWFGDKALKEYPKQQKRFTDIKNASQITNLKKPAALLTNLNTLSNNFLPAANNSQLLESTKLPFKVRVLKDKYLSDLQNFNENYKFTEDNFNWLKANSNSNNHTRNVAKASPRNYNNEIMDCKTFGSIQDFIKSLPRNITQSLLGDSMESGFNCSSSDTFGMATSATASAEDATTTAQPADSDLGVQCSTINSNQEKNVSETNTEAERSTESSSEATETTQTAEVKEVTEANPPSENEKAESSEVGDVKLNITISANIQGNPKKKLFLGNCSFAVVPSFMDDRHKRDLMPSPLDKIENHGRFENVKPVLRGDHKHFADLASGKLSSNVIEIVFNAVQQTPDLKELWPSLKRNQEKQDVVIPNFYPIRNENTEGDLKYTEKLLAQVLNSLNAIIDQQVRSKTCVPLRPDLQEFYNMIEQFRHNQDTVREKRRLTKPTNSDDFSYKVHLLDPNEIERETKIVKKLLKQYEELPLDDLHRVAVVRDQLLRNLFILQRLQDNEEGQWQQLKEKREPDVVVTNEDVIKSLQSHYSSEFLRLLTTANLYRGEGVS